MFEGRIERANLGRGLLEVNEQHEVRQQKIAEKLSSIELDLAPKPKMKGCLNCKWCSCVNYGKDRTSCSKYIAD